MSSKTETEKQKLIQDKCQVILGNLLREEDNKYCVDCDAKGPRWASWNLGIFLCIKCAGIHRNLGVHISKVKSVNLDTWTPEQIAYLQQMGNSQARAVYEANLPESFRRPQYDSSLEAFIRAKYEQKKYIAKEWIPQPPPKPAFDIEEERKREKEKKKKNIPALTQLKCVPRPHSGSLVSPSTKPATTEEELKNSLPHIPEGTDLLGLDETDSEDIFDEFLSAPSTSTSENKTIDLNTGIEASNRQITKDEADFFNQKSDEISISTSKMTKESILSLYSTNVPVQPTQSLAPVFGLPGGMYVPQSNFTQMASYAVYPNPGINAISQQMSNVQLNGQTWTMTSFPNHISSSGLVIGSGSANVNAMWPTNGTGQNQNISSNIWQ